MDEVSRLVDLHSTDSGSGEQKHTFSPDAVPFMPNKCSSVNSRVTATSCLSVDAPEFYPKNFASYSKVDCGKVSIGCIDVVLEVRLAIKELTLRPADFNEVMTALVQMLVTAELDESSLAAVVEEIFVQRSFTYTCFNDSNTTRAGGIKSQREPNFRYNGARMCSLLSESLQLDSGASFQSYLINRCLAEFDYQIQCSGDNLAALIELALFISELMLNMRDADFGQVITHFPQLIAQLLFLFLGKYSHSDLAMHCVIQVLKLTGAVLEEHIPCLDEVFSRIRTLILSPNTSQNLRALLVCLVELRASNWGRYDEFDQTVGAGDSVICSPASQEYQTPEETCLTMMADEHGYSHGMHGLYWAPVDFSYTQDAVPAARRSEYWAGDQAMDAETAAAFEQFIAGCRSRRLL